MLSIQNRWMQGGLFLLFLAISYAIVMLSSTTHSSPPLNFDQRTPTLKGMMVTKDDIKRLLSWNLFGQSIIDIASAKNLSFKITGIIQSSLPQRAAVLATTKGDKENIYKIGDLLPSGDKLEKIEKDRVVILHNGVLRAIIFEQNDSSVVASSPREINVDSDSNITITNTYNNIIKEPRPVSRYNRIQKY